MGNSDDESPSEKLSPRGLMPILGVVALSLLALFSSFQQLSPISSSYQTSYYIAPEAGLAESATVTSITQATTKEEPISNQDDDRKSVLAPSSNVTRAEAKPEHHIAKNATIDAFEKVTPVNTTKTKIPPKDVANTTAAAPINMPDATTNSTTTEEPDITSSNHSTANITFWTRYALGSLKQSKVYVARKHGTEHPGIFELLKADFRVCDDMEHCPTNKAMQSSPPAHPLFHNNSFITLFFERIDKASKIYRKPEAQTFLALTFFDHGTQQHVPFIVKDDNHEQKTARLRVKMCEGEGCPRDCSHRQKETNSSFPYYWDAEDHQCRSTNPFFSQKYGNEFGCGCKSVCFTPEAIQDSDVARYWPWQNKSERELYVTDDPAANQQLLNTIKKEKQVRTLKQEFSEYKPRFDCHNNTSKTIPLPFWAGFTHHLFIFPKAKLIFCGIPKSGITEWNSFLRFVNGAKDYLARPHDKMDRFDFLLSSMTPEKASELLLDPTWTKATFFRDPAERLLSAYLNKVVKERYTQTAFKIGVDGDPSNRKMLSFEEFVGLVTMPPKFVNGTLANVPIGHGLHAKTDPHWRPQSMMCGLDFLLPHFDFVGNFNFISQHTKLLLQQVGLWEDYGSKFDDGSGEYKVGQLCSQRPKGPGDSGYNASRVPSGFNQRDITGHHATNSKEKLAKYYTPSLLERVRKAYALDFAIFDELQSRAEESVDNVASGKDLKAVQSYCGQQQTMIAET